MNNYNGAFWGRQEPETTTAATIKVNTERITQTTGIKFDESYNLADLFTFVRIQLEWLEMHNKNLTKAQYFKITDLLNILECVEVEV